MWEVDLCLSTLSASIRPNGRVGVPPPVAQYRRASVAHNSIALQSKACLFEITMKLTGNLRVPAAID